MRPEREAAEQVEPRQRENRPSPSVPAEAARPAPLAVGQRIAVLIDVAKLQAEARAQGGEISFARLLRSIAGPRPVIRAVAYLHNDLRPMAATLVGNGIEVEVLPEGESIEAAVAVDAMATASRVDCTVMVPEAGPYQHLLRSLRSQGLKVETAGFQRSRAGLLHHNQLGRDCLFVP